MDRQILLGEFYGSDRDEYYREKEGIVRLMTREGILWVPLVLTGVKQHKFEPKTDRVIVFLLDPDYISTQLVDRNKSGRDVVLAADSAFGILIRLPHQYIQTKPEKDRDEANVPTKILVDSSNETKERLAMGTKDYRIVVDDEKILLKGEGGQIIVGKDGIVTKGKIIDSSFFGGSKGGILKESWIGGVIPSSVVTPFPTHTIDDTLLKRVQGLAEQVTDIKKGM